MPQERNTEETLRELIRSKGVAYLREGNLFVNAVEDMGEKKGNVRLLRYLVEVDGANALLDAGGKPLAERQTIYSQTVEKICDTSQISPELAQRVCAAFWYAVYNEAPPVTYKGQEKLALPSEPALKPSPAPRPELKPDFFPPEPVPPAPPDPSSVPAGRKHKFVLFRPEHSTAERRLLMLGWLIILVYSLFSLISIVVACIRGPFLFAIWGPLVPGTYYILPAARRQYCLWNQTIENWQPKKRLWRGLFERWTVFGEMAAFTMSIAWPIIMLLVPDLAEMRNNPWWYFLMGFPFYTIYYICSFIWRRRRKKKA